MRETREEAESKLEPTGPARYNQDCETEPASGEEKMAAAGAWRDHPRHGTEGWGGRPPHSLGRQKVSLWLRKVLSKA